jgi:hypothetical protein
MDAAKRRAIGRGEEKRKNLVSTVDRTAVKVLMLAFIYCLIAVHLMDTSRVLYEQLLLDNADLTKLSHFLFHADWNFFDPVEY